MVRRGRTAGLDRRDACGHGVAHLHPARGRRHHPHLLRQGGGAPAWLSAPIDDCDAPHRRSRALFERACDVLPGGVNSPVRAFSAVGGTPRFVARGGGRAGLGRGRPTLPRLRRRVGPDAPRPRAPAVVEAITARRARARPTARRRARGRAWRSGSARLVPSIEMVQDGQLRHRGDDGRAAAGARGAPAGRAIVKFAGCYHGHGDCFLSRPARVRRPSARPDSPGVTAGDGPRHAGRREFNDLGSGVEACLRAYPTRSPPLSSSRWSATWGSSRPARDFLAGSPRALHALTVRCSIFDEVMTGFRLAPGRRAAAISASRPDLTTLGKILGGGLPVGAYGGGRDLMAQIAPAGPIYQAGTMSGNPWPWPRDWRCSTRLRRTPGLYDRLERRGAALESGDRRRWCGGKGYPCHFARVGSMWTLFFTPDEVTDWATASAADRARFGRFFHAMLARGISLAPSQFEANFISGAHTDDDIARDGRRRSPSRWRSWRERHLVPPRAAASEPVERTPVWIMRQAGRYLPEYRALRAKADFLACCRTPELACEITLQPVRRLDVDAAILFSDILVPLPAMGVDVTFNPGPVSRAAGARRAQDVDGAAGAGRPRGDAVCPRAIRLLRRALPPAVPLIGFAGAPFTLADVPRRGRRVEALLKPSRSLLFSDPAPPTPSSAAARTRRVAAGRAGAGRRAGGDALRHLGRHLLGPADYAAFARPYVRRVFDACASRRARPDSPDLLRRRPAGGRLAALGDVART